MSSGLPRVCTIDELSVILSIPKKTLYNWVSRNEIPHIKMGRLLRFHLHEVLAHFQAETQARRPACLQWQSKIKNGVCWSVKNREVSLGRSEKE